MEHQDAQTKSGHSADHGKEATASRDGSGDEKKARPPG